MIAMDEQERIQYEAQSQALRVELKQWENNWAKEHAGKKPARNDIKQNPEIAQKYKSYNKIRDIISGKILPPSKQHPTPRKRKSTDGPAPAQTPSKRPRPAETPTRAQSHVDGYGHGSGGHPAADAVTPSLSRRLFSPAVPTSIGPTPQRDGRVLGLFDLLAGSDADNTPSRPRSTTATATTTATDAAAAVQATPRKHTGAVDHHHHAPTSGGREDAFATTPLRGLDGNARSSGFAARVGLEGRTTTTATATTPRGPRSASALQFATPAFLKRGCAPLPPSVDENGEYVESPRPLRLPRKPLVRGLSSVVAGLRRLEEEALDEDLEALREVEMEMEGGVQGGAGAGVGLKAPPAGGDRAVELEDVFPAAPARGDSGPSGAGGVPVEVEDSQAQPPTLLGGFDDEALYDSPVEEAMDRGRPLRVFKKKGQKRTTRRVNMKPTRLRRPMEEEDAEGGGDETDGEVVPETQLDTTKAMADRDLLDAASGSEFDGSDSEQDGKEAAKKKKKKEAAAKAKAKKGKAEAKEKEDGPVKRAVRKVKATAHANFKRLKLRNNGAKGGAGYNSRFRRKR